MTLEDFDGVLDTLKKKNKAMSGKPTVAPLKQSQKDMIKKTKEMKVI